MEKSKRYRDVEIRARARKAADGQELADRGAVAHADEQPRSGRGREPQGAGGLWRHRPRRARLGLLRPHRRVAEEPERGRNPAGAVRQAGGRVQDPRERAARADRQLQPGAALGHLGTLQRAGRARPGHVRPDDRRQLDLYRQPGHRAGHLRDLRRSRSPALRRQARGPLGADRRPGRHGRRAAAGRHAGRRLLAEHRMPAEQHRLPPAYPLCRRAGRRSGRRAGTHRPLHQEGRAISIALCGNAAEILPELVRRGVRPDMVTDQTSAHDPLNGYLPVGWTWAEYRERAKRAGRRGQGGQAVHGPARARHARIPEAGRAHLRLRQQHPPDGQEEGVDNAFDFPGFVPAYIRPLFCRGVGPFRWAALSGDPQDIYKTDAKVRN